MQKIVSEALTSPNGPLAGEKIKQIASVSGGCIHKAWHIELQNGQHLFAKTASTEAFPMLKYEAECLNALKEFANETFLVVPKPFVIRKLHNMSTLLTPWLSLGYGNQEVLGKGLALLHKNSSEQSPRKFGWPTDGFIGTQIQTKGWVANWGECFVNLRLQTQLNIASKWGLNSSDYRELLKELILFLNTHKPQPSLVHGDLWIGNSSIDSNSKGAVFDPASWWADREVDIAMTKLFGGFSEDFYKGYEKIWPLSNTANERKDIYNLYHLLNHANMFGGSYINQCTLLLKTLKLKFQKSNI